jgi:IS605 OrfB family transposase
VDLNALHLDGWVLDPSGNPVGVPYTIPLVLEGLPASTRDGRLRAAVAEVVHLAKAADCRCIVVEDLDFADARQTGRETMGRGAGGKRFRRLVAGMPTRQFRQLLVGMAANAGLWVVAVDPAWTSVWGARYWQAPLNQSTKTSVTVTRHHAAAVVIGRRGLGYRARRRGWCAWRRPEDRRQRAADSAGQAMMLCVPLAAQQVVPEPTVRGPDGPGGQRAGPAAHKTPLPERDAVGDQVAQDRPGPPVSVA